jgi:hypothetical protein
MGTTLIPAFFVTLIQLRINESDVKRLTVNLLKHAVCPSCNSKNHIKVDDTTLNIVVNSPKLSPLIREKQLLHSPRSPSAALRPRKVSSEGSAVSIVIEHSIQNEPEAR